MTCSATQRSHLDRNSFARLPLEPNLPSLWGFDELGTPLPAQPGEIKAKILVLHGDAGPLVSFDSVMAFRAETLTPGLTGRSICTAAQSTVSPARARFLVRRPKPSFSRRRTQGHGKRWLTFLQKYFTRNDSNRRGFCWVRVR
jgi:hypothetical protein